MNRLLLLAFYFGAEVLDHSLGYLWQANLPGSNDHRGSNGTNSTNNSSGGETGCEADDDVGMCQNRTRTHRDDTWTFGWWRIRGTVEYIFGTGGTISGDEERINNGHWFSALEGTGRMGCDAGWIGYFIDSVGVSAFGAWWSYAAWTGVGAGVIILLGMLAYSLQTLLAPVRWMTTMLDYPWARLAASVVVEVKTKLPCRKGHLWPGMLSGVDQRQDGLLKRVIYKKRWRGEDQGDNWTMYWWGFMDKLHASNKMNHHSGALTHMGWRWSFRASLDAHRGSSDETLSWLVKSTSADRSSAASSMGCMWRSTPESIGKRCWTCINTWNPGFVITSYVSYGS